MSALPAAVQKSIDEANRLIAENAAARNGTAPPPAAAAPPEPAAAPPEPAAAAPPAPPAPMPESDWEKRYRVLQGKYNAEVPRLQKQSQEQGALLQQLQSQLTSTQGLLAALGNRSAEPAPAPAAPLVSESEVKEFGPDLIDVMRRVARQEQGSLIPEIEKRVRPVAQQAQAASQSAAEVGEEARKLKQRQVVDFLSTEVPAWQQLNTDPLFLAWLEQVDPYAGEVRGAMLDRAYRGNDGPRVVAFFKGYLKENAVVAPPAPPPPPAAHGAPQVGLESLVAPGAPRSGAPNAPDGSGKRIWTRAEISQFYKAKSDGRFNSEDGRKRAAALEQDIFAAQREHRVR